jgi:peptidyl-prolyl cis-trans isomerase SurA
MKKLLLLSLLVLTSTFAFAQREVIDKVVSQVGGELVLLSEVEDQYALLASREQGEMPENARCFILDQVMSSKLLVNQAKLDSIEVSDEEVEAQLDARFQQILQYMNGDVKQFEEYYGQTIPEVKEAFREDLKNQLLTERMRSSIMANITVTPNEVKEFYAEIPVDSLPYFNAEVEVGEIVIKPVVNDAEKQKAKDQLAALRARIVEGEDFAELATKNSQDFGSARIGGDLGWAQRGKFVPEFEAAAYKLEAGEMSPVFESPFGFHVLQLLERRGNSIHTRHILIRPEMTQADLDKAENLLDSVRHLVMNDSLSFSRAMKKYGYDETQSYNNDGRMVNPNTGDTFFEIGDLDPDVYFAVDTMEVGSISAPFAFKDQGGDPYFRIVQLRTRTMPHKANLKQDYNKIKQAAIQAKQSEFIAEWVEKTINQTYIQVEDGFNSNCDVLQKWTDKVQP